MIQRTTASALPGLGHVTHLHVGFFVSVGVHGRQEMDAGLGHQPDNALVAPLVLPAEVLHEVEDQLPAQGLIAVHPGHVAELRLPCQTRKRLTETNGGLRGQPPISRESARL